MTLIINKKEALLMRAIQIRLMGSIEGKPCRFRAWSEGGISFEVPVDERLNLSDQAYVLAWRYLVENGMGDCECSGFGTLPNGDFVATVRFKV